jgi:anti-anti-sigma factor
MLAGSGITRRTATAGPADRLTDLSGRDRVDSATQLDIRLSTEDDSAVLEVGGEVDLDTAQQFRDALHRAQEARRVVVDLSGVSFMDSAGVNAIIGAYNRLPPDGELRVIRLRANVRRVFEITGLLALLGEDLPPTTSAS